MTDTVHVYLFDGYADWEPAFAMAGIQNPAFQREPGRWQVRTVGERPGRPVRSMGGLVAVPELGLRALDPAASAILILPGGMRWDEPHAHRDVIATAASFLARGVPVAAICGATAGLARAGLLDRRPHTSNAASYLKGTGYAGSACYVDAPAVRADGLITAGGMAPIDFAREIFAELAIYDDEALEAWFQLYKTGKSAYFARMERAADAPRLDGTRLARRIVHPRKGLQMRNANRPAGPGTPTNERRDSATEREELEAMTDDAQGRADEPQRDPVHSARQAERDAHVKRGGRADVPGPSRDRSRP